MTERYWAAFRRQVFLLLKAAHDRLLTSAYSQSEEEDITGILANEIETFIQSADAPSWSIPFVVHDNPPVNDGIRKGKRRKRLDIVLVRTERGTRPRYEFEAKRLSKRYGLDRYCGADGLGAFINHEYGLSQEEAGMLGYVQTGTPAEWAAKAERLFGEKREQLHISGRTPWGTIKIPGSPPHCYRSKHIRTGSAGLITIVHLFLDFSQDESQTTLGR
jgi:hypothetical protein